MIHNYVEDLTVVGRLEHLLVPHVVQEDVGLPNSGRRDSDVGNVVKLGDIPGQVFVRPIPPQVKHARHVLMFFIYFDNLVNVDTYSDH